MHFFFMKKMWSLFLSSSCVPSPTDLEENILFSFCPSVFLSAFLVFLHICPVKFKFACKLCSVQGTDLLTPGMYTPP